MAKLIYAENNNFGFDIIARIDEDGTAKVMIESACFPNKFKREKVVEFLNSIQEKEWRWETDHKQLKKRLKNYRILVEIEKERC